MSLACTVAHGVFGCSVGLAPVGMHSWPELPWRLVSVVACDLLGFWSAATGWADARSGLLAGFTCRAGLGVVGLGGGLTGPAG